MSVMTDSIQEILERVHQEEYSQILATLIGGFGDFDLAEEALQDAFLAAVKDWTQKGVPRKPAAWLTTTVRRKAIDRLRRRRFVAADPQNLETLPPDQLSIVDEYADNDEIPDERLKLIFTCCHPALPPEQ